MKASYSTSNDELYNKLQELIQTYRPTIVNDGITIDIQIQGQSLYKIDKTDTNIVNKINKR